MKRSFNTTSWWLLPSSPSLLLHLWRDASLFICKYWIRYEERGKMKEWEAGSLHGGWTSSFSCLDNKALNVKHNVCGSRCDSKAKAKERKTLNLDWPWLRMSLGTHCSPNTIVSNALVSIDMHTGTHKHPNLGVLAIKRRPSTRLSHSASRVISSLLLSCFSLAQGFAA